MNGDTIKYAADFGTAMLDILNKTDLLRHGLLAIASIKLGQGISTIGLSIADAAKQMNTLGGAIQKVKSLPLDNILRKETMIEVGNATIGLTDKNLKLLLSQKQLTAQEKIAILSQHNLTEEEARAKLEKMGLISATNAQTTANTANTTSTFTLSGALTALKTSAIGAWQAFKVAFLSNPIGFTLMGITTAVSIFSTAISDHNQKVEEARQKNIEAANSASEEAKELSNLYVQYEKLNGIQKKTSTQEEQFKTVVESITKALGEKASALSNLKAGTDEYTESLKDATKAELENQYATAKMGAKAAEDELKNNTWDDWSGSQVTIQQNEQMTGVKNHVAALNEVKDILSAYEDRGTHGIEWEPINWDKDKNDMNAVVEYYNALLKARNQLVISDNSEFLMSSDIYQDINTTINNLSESVEEYTKQKYEALKLEYMWKNGIPKTQEEFNQMEQSILDASDAGQTIQNILKSYAKQDYSILNNSINEVEESIEALQDKATEPPIFSLSDESITTAIDDFQKKIKTLQNAISDFQNNAEFDKTDLFQEFPELIHQSDNLESAIENLMQNALEELLETLNNPPDELRRELEKLVAVISVDTKQAVEDNLSSYRELYNILHMVQAGENIQQNVLATLINKYGDLAGAVVRTTDGYTLEEKAVTTLINKYVESSNTAIAAQIDITKQTIDNIKARISAYQTETRALNELVAAQTRQYQTIGEYLSAKGNGNVLDQNAIRDASARFGADAVSSYVDYIKNGGASQIKELEDAEAYLEKLKKSLKSPLESKSSSSSESSSSKSTSEIDWMTNSINNLQSAVDGLEQSFNNAKGIKNQKNALKELNKELHTLRDSYYSLTDNSDTVYGEYSKRYKGSLSQLGSNSASIKAKIEAGDIFDLSEFRSDTAELINAAIDAWNGMTDSKNKYIELGVQLEENSVKLIQMDIDAISSKMDLANIKLDSSVSDDRKLKIYDDLAKKTEEYYIKKLELAKLEEDSVQYDSLKVEKANALKDIEEEKLEIIRKQNDAVVDGIDRQINNINTSVELNGGKYLSSDYDNLLLLNEQKTAQLLSNYNRELTNLSDLRAAIGENSAEYREQKSRVDSIADSIDDCKINSKEWTKALLELPIKEIETSVKNLNEQLSGVKDSMSDVEQMISGATAYIKQEIEDQQKLKNVIQEQLDNLKNSNSEHERAIALQKAQYELDRAYKQKTTKVYRDGQGFVYEQSQSAIRTAQENLNKANYDIAIAALEKQLDYYDEIIEELQEVQDKWSNLTGKAQEFLDIQVAISKLGIDKILSGDGIGTYTDYYTALLENQNALEESVASLEDLQVRLEDIVDMYHMGMIDASQATSLLRDALAGVYGAINTETGESTAASIQNIINRIKELNGINFTFDELILRISDVFTEFQQANYEDIDTFAGKISNLIEQFYKLESAGDVTAISDWLSSIKDLGGSDFIDAETIVDIIDLYRQTVSAASDTSAAADIVEETANNVETTVDAEKKKVNEAISDVEEDAKKGEEIISSLSEKIDLILSKLDELSSSEFMAKFSQEQLVQAESFTSQLENCFSSMAENIASNISSVFNNLNSELSRIASEAASTASSIHSMISNANLKASELQTTKNQVAAITTSNTSNTIKQTSTGKFTMMKYHDGIENGLVGGKPEKVLQTAALDKLESNEILALLEIDEAVLTRFQQNNIVENMKKSFTAGLNFIPQRDTSSINMQFGNINVTEVDNGQEVVDYLVSNLKPRIQQVLSKR